MNEFSDPLLLVELLVGRLLVALHLLCNMVLVHHAVFGLDFVLLHVVLVVVWHALILLLRLFDPQFVLDLLVEVLEGLLFLPTLVVLLRLVQILH